MKKLLLLTLFVAFCFTSSAQNLDSLWAVWQDKTQHDTTRLQAIHKYAWDGYLYTKPDSAFYYAQLQNDFAKEKGIKNQMASALNTQGASFYVKGEYNKAVDYFTQSLKIKEEIGDKKGVASTLNNIGIILKNLGDYDKAIDHYNKSIKIKEEIGDKKGLAFPLNNIGAIYQAQGDYSKAIDFYFQSLKIEEEIDRKQGVASCFNNLGIIYQDQGDYAKAIIFYTKSLEIYEQIGDKNGVSMSLSNVGILYRLQGDYARAIDSYNQSLKIQEETGNKQVILGTLNNIGAIYYSQGDYMKAIDFYSQSLKIIEKIGNKHDISSPLNNIGVVYQNQGDSASSEGNAKFAADKYAKAINFFSQSLKIKESIGDQQGITVSLNNLGNTYKLHGDFALAIGDTTLSADMYIKALKYGIRAFSIATEIGVSTETRRIARLLTLSYVYFDSINRAVEMTNLLESFRLKDLDINFPTLSEQQKENYFTTMQSDFDLLFDFAFHHMEIIEQTEKSFNNALLTKGLTLKSSTAMRTAIQNSGDTSLISQYENWLSLKKKIANTNEIDSTYKELVTQANELERELVNKSTIFSDFDKVKNLKWQDVQTGLKPNEAAIEFVNFKSEIDTTHPIIYAALIIKKDSEHPEMVQLCSEAELKEILGVFQVNSMSFVNKVYGTKSKAEKALYEKIWQPLEKHLEGIENIYYSPSGLLHKVSFAAISKDNNVFLCDNYQLHQQSSTGKVALPSNVMYDTKDAYLLMGGVQYNTDKTKKEVWNYLPGTLNETDNIHSFLEKKKHSVSFLANQDANETNFKKQAQNANVLHISTHGFFYPDPDQVRAELDKDVEEIQGDIQFRGTEALDSAERSSSLYANWSFVINKNPLMRSGLVLAGANDVWQRSAMEEGEDGILTAQEVSNLDLRNTKLVVLSACETGLGDIKGSEGVFGLQRAFKMAGAEYLIMSLWQVPDKETAEFMELFYKNLVKVKDIPKSFNLTQQVMRKKYDPYFWAAFVLIN